MDAEKKNNKQLEAESKKLDAQIAKEESSNNANGSKGHLENQKSIDLYPDSKFILNTIIDGYILADTDGVIKDVNKSYCDLIGYTREELLAMNIRELEMTIPKNEVKRRINEMVAKGKDRFETKHLHKDGYIVDLETSISIIHHDNITLVSAFLRDITSQIKAEEAVKDSSYLLSESQKVASIGSYMMEVEKGLWTSSDVLDDIFGITAEYKRDVKNWLEIVHPDDREMMAEYLEMKVLTNIEPFNKEYRIIRINDKNLLWVNGLGRLETNSKGDVLRMIGTIQDITKKKLAELKLRNSDDGLKKIVIASSGKEGEEYFKAIVTVLEETTKATYTYVGEYIGENKIKTIALSHLGKIQKNFEYSLQGTPCQDVFNLQTCIFPSGIQDLFPEDKDLVEMGIEAYIGTPFYNANNECLGILVCLFDYPVEDAGFIKSALEIFSVNVGSEMSRLRAELDLRESEKSLKDSQYLAKLGNWRLNYLNNQLYLSDELYRIFNIDLNGPELDNDEFLNYVHPEDRQMVEKAFQDHIQNKKPYDINHRILLKDGTIKYMHEICRTEFDDKGEAIISKGITQDVTEQKKTQEVMLKLNMAFNNSNEAIFITDNNGIITFINSGFTKLYGFSAKEVVGKVTPRILKSGIYSEEHSQYLWKTLLDKKSLPASEYINKCKDGRLIDIEGSAEPIIDENGVLIGFLGIQRDISERKKAKQNLEDALEKAKESDRLKSTFLATMSHELRTPLNAIIGFSGVIEADVSIEDIITYAKIINQSGNQLLNIVEDLFDITMIEAGQINIQKHHVNLHAILDYINEITELEKRKLSKENLEIIQSIPLGRKSLIINTDPVKLKQIIINLIKNAIKFTKTGYVRYGYETINENDKSLVKIFVEDTGIGIPKDEQDLIFDVFRQSDESMTKESGGAGIGLSISKKLTELLGGEIHVDSEEGKGSSFHFTLPGDDLGSNSWEDAADNHAETKPSQRNKKKKVLIVEDVLSNYKFLNVVLKKSGIETIWAESGEKALELCRDDHTISLVLMDINLTGINGYETTKEIRKFSPKLPIIAQTAYAIDGDKNKSLEAGCDDYISKPIDKKVLLSKIAHLLGEE